VLGKVRHGATQHLVLNGEVVGRVAEDDSSRRNAKRMGGSGFSDKLLLHGFAD
jgi:hypothetical protein